MTLVPEEQVESAICTVVTELEAIEYMNSVVPDMINLLTLENGKGLSAPQVGINKKFFILRLEDGSIKTYFNAKYYDNATRTQSVEGCLTYPNDFYKVKRFKSITAPHDEIINQKLVLVRKIMRGIDAIAYQHECDHHGGSFSDKGITIKMIGTLYSQRQSVETVTQE